MEKTQSKRQQWSDSDMSKALSCVKQKQMGWKLASKTFNVPSSTLRRRAANKNTYAINETKGFLGGSVPTFDKDIEDQITKHIKELETRFYGLTMLELRKLAFDLAEKNGIPHKFNKEKGVAGWNWIKGFLRRNPSISLRKPELTSAARAQAFNKPRIKDFFKRLAEVLDSNDIRAENIWNVDESGFSTVQSRSVKIFATKGRKQVGFLSSAERGKHFTVICAMSAIGAFVPPAIVFPRKKMKTDLMDHAPPGFVSYCQENGWVNKDIFLK